MSNQHTLWKKCMAWHNKLCWEVDHSTKSLRRQKHLSLGREMRNVSKIVKRKFSFYPDDITLHTGIVT